MSDPLDLARKRADQLMPEWAYKSSRTWYSGGRERRDDARMILALVAELEATRAALRDLVALCATEEIYRLVGIERAAAAALYFGPAVEAARAVLGDTP